MTEIVVFASAHGSTEREILRAACMWVRGITSHPNNWAGQEEINLILAVREAYPNLRCRWVENPDYADWSDATDPRSLLD